MKKMLILMVVVPLILAACQPMPAPASPTPTLTSPSPPTPTLPPVSEEESGPHFLLATASLVQLNRDGWTGYHPVAFGTILSPVDLLKVGDETRVLCAGPDLAVKTVAAGEHRVPCPPQEGILIYDKVRFGARRAGIATAGEIPFILYPRTTLLLDDRPTLTWNDTGAGSYTVSLTQGGQEVWTQEEVTGHSLPYPDNEPALESGQDYKLVVIDNDSQISSRQKEPAGTGFRLATLEERQEIEADLEKIKAAADLTDMDRDFALGVYYAGLEISSTSGFSPLGEAWLLFDQLAETQEAPVIHLWYGDVLTGLLLPDQLAKAAYETAQANAEALGDLESQAAAGLRLWCLTETEAYIDQAIELYTTLGDQAEVDRLAEGKGDWITLCK